MATVAEKYADNVTGSFYVDKQCILCHLCSDIAPAFFKESADGDHDYDVFAMEKVIRIRQALEKGYSLEKAAQIVQREMNTLAAEIERLGSLGADELEAELRRRIERLEERLASVRRTLPAALEMGRLRRAVALLARLEAQGDLHRAGSDGDAAKSMTLRLSRAVEELELVIAEGRPAQA